MVYFYNTLTHELLTREEALEELKAINETLELNFTLTDFVNDKIYVITESEE